MNDEAPRETLAGWFLLAVGTAITILAPVLLIFTASYVQLHPALGNYDIGLVEPPPPPDLLAIVASVGKLVGFGIVAAVASGIASLRITLGNALTYIAAPLMIAGLLSVWWQLSVLWSLVTLAVVAATVGWLWLSTYLLNRLLAPRARPYEPVVFDDSGWTEAADESDLD